MSGKFWDMYKGKSSYDSFDESDEEMVEEMGIDEERQSLEEDQPEDRGDRDDKTTTGKTKHKNGESVIIAYKVNFFLMTNFFFYLL